MKKVIIKDSTLREGLDTPSVQFTMDQKLKIIRSLDQAGVSEAEIIAPSRVLRDLEFARMLKRERLQIKTSGLVYSYSPHFQEEIEEAVKYLDRIDLLMPLSLSRKPYDRDSKIRLLLDSLKFTQRYQCEIGVGFPNSTQTEEALLLDIGEEALENGAKRITIYDTNGSSDPFAIYNLVKKIKEKLDVPLLFHGHNDLGLATANSLSAVNAGVDCLDVAVNGLGDRAGNASLEQLIMVLHLKGFSTGVTLQRLKQLSSTVEDESGVEVSKLAPIVGEYIFHHISPSHLNNPEVFEAFNPQLLGITRNLDKKR